MVMVPQLLMLTGRGATKSLTSAGKEADERLFRKPLANASQVLPKTPAANPAAERFTRLPQHGSAFLEKHWLLGPLVTHFSRPSTGLPPPLVKSKVISRSPAVRLSVLGPVVVRFGWVFWLISKSMLAEPSTFDRSQARYR